MNMNIEQLKEKVDQFLTDNKAYLYITERGVEQSNANAMLLEEAKKRLPELNIEKALMNNFYGEHFVSLIAFTYNNKRYKAGCYCGVSTGYTTFTEI